MGGWPAKYVIGLTGNIATGKSVVRKMLEHLGAYGIDADALSHQVIKKNSPGYQPVVQTFGKWILAPDGEIDRSRLGRIVFADVEALHQLERIIHPHVSLAINALVSRTTRTVVVIEAIKLLESGLVELCDSIWTVVASRDVQIKRLVAQRDMSEAEAIQRIDSQPSQEVKIKSAQVVIRNDGTYEETWKQVHTAWQAAFAAEGHSLPEVVKNTDGLTVRRARPGEAEQIASLINRLSGGTRNLDYRQVMEAFGEKAYLILSKDGDPCGVASWQVENLIVRIGELYLEENLAVQDALPLLLKEVEDTSRELECEISLLILPKEYQGYEKILTALGYSSKPIAQLGVHAWEGAVRESSAYGVLMMYKILRKEQVLKPV